MSDDTPKRPRFNLPNLPADFKVSDQVREKLRQMGQNLASLRVPTLADLSPAASLEPTPSQGFMLPPVKAGRFGDAFRKLWMEQPTDELKRAVREVVKKFTKFPRGNDTNGWAMRALAIGHKQIGPLELASMQEAVLNHAFTEAIGAVAAFLSPSGRQAEIKPGEPKPNPGGRPKVSIQKAALYRRIKSFALAAKTKSKARIAHLLKKPENKELLASVSEEATRTSNERSVRTPEHVIGRALVWVDPTTSKPQG